jgi:hypothetical protein
MCADIAMTLVVSLSRILFLNAANHFLKAVNVSSVDIFRISLVLTKKNRNLKVLEKSRALAGTWEYD